MGITLLLVDFAKCSCQRPDHVTRSFCRSGRTEAQASNGHDERKLRMDDRDQAEGLEAETPIRSGRVPRDEADRPETPPMRWNPNRDHLTRVRANWGAAESHQGDLAGNPRSHCGVREGAGERSHGEGSGLPIQGLLRREWNRSGLLGTAGYRRLVQIGRGERRSRHVRSGGDPRTG